MEQRFVIVVTENRVLRMDTATGETWKHEPFEYGSDGWRAVEEPEQMPGQPSDVWDFLQEQVDQWTPDRETGRMGFDDITRPEVREFVAAARARWAKEVE